MNELSISILGLIAGLAAAVAVGGVSVFVLLRHKIEKLSKLAAIDDLTQLYNSREFNRRLVEEIAQAKRYNTLLSMALLDIDHFKSVNDAYGYDAGDSVLKEFAQFIKSRVRAADVVFRYKQGDEFAILAIETVPSGAKAMAERLRKALAAHRFQIPGEKSQPDGRLASITVSAGVVGFDASRDTAEAFRKRAESALEAAKKMTDSVVVEGIGDPV